MVHLCMGPRTIQSCTTQSWEVGKGIGVWVRILSGLVLILKREYVRHINSLNVILVISIGMSTRFFS